MNKTTRFRSHTRLIGALVVLAALTPARFHKPQYISWTEEALT